ncbi:polyadenylate-binding protein 4-like [Hibiscus syriacus]|uniref:polyadenylate-binding protein 4-like n=1 Tax=Hibiscus syriacus TaxID=106335 RepID=UPI00192366F0|nr:polyadenylate-binding protein 4-like [Hibiscus syriacus]
MSERVRKVETDREIGQSFSGVSWTVFVDNLSKKVSRRELRDLFLVQGQVVRVFIPNEMNKLKYKSYTFAFVQFVNEAGIRKAVENLNRLWIDGRKVFVGVAKYKKDRSRL